MRMAIWQGWWGLVWCVAVLGMGVSVDEGGEVFGDGHVVGVGVLDDGGFEGGGDF